MTNRIAELRKERKLSQAELAEAGGRYPPDHYFTGEWAVQRLIAAGPPDRPLF